MGELRTVIDFARRNGGIVTTQQATALGLSKTTLYRRVEDGVFVKVARGVFALPGTATRPDLAIRAAQRLMGAVVSHQSAAGIHDFQPQVAGPPTVTVAHRSTHAFEGVVVRQSTDLLEAHVEEIRGYRVTTAVRTLADLSSITGRERLERLVEYTLTTGLVTADQLVQMSESLSRRGKRGMPNMRSVVDEMLGGTVSDSEFERQLFQLIRGASLPLPEKQFKAPWLRRLNGRVDFAYPEHRIVLEADSRRWHMGFDAFETDKERSNAAQIAGWIILQVTWRKMKDDPIGVVAMVRTALDARISVDTRES